MKKVLSKKEKARRQTIRRSPKIKQAIRRLDPSRILTLDLEMHAIWFCSMNKWYIWQNLTKPQPDYSRFTRLDVVRANNVPDVLSEHREILRVIREKDLDAIEPLIRRHLYGGLRRMGTQLYAEKYRPYFTGI